MTLEEKEVYLLSEILNDKNCIEFILLETNSSVKEIHILSENKKLLIIIENSFPNLEEALEFICNIRDTKLLYGFPYKIIN